jgi:hypothetical protein
VGSLFSVRAVVVPFFVVDPDILGLLDGFHVRRLLGPLLLVLFLDGGGRTLAIAIAIATAAASPRATPATGFGDFLPRLFGDLLDLFDDFFLVDDLDLHFDFLGHFLVVNRFDVLGDRLRLAPPTAATAAATRTTFLGRLARVFNGLGGLRVGHLLDVLGLGDLALHLGHELRRSLKGLERRREVLVFFDRRFDLGLYRFGFRREDQAQLIRQLGPVVPTSLLLRTRGLMARPGERRQIFGRLRRLRLGRRRRGNRFFFDLLNLLEDEDWRLFRRWPEGVLYLFGGVRPGTLGHRRLFVWLLHNRGFLAARLLRILFFLGGWRCPQ